MPAREYSNPAHDGGHAWMLSLLWPYAPPNGIGYCPVCLVHQLFWDHFYCFLSHWPWFFKWSPFNPKSALSWRGGHPPQAFGEDFWTSYFLFSSWQWRPPSFSLLLFSSSEPSLFPLLRSRNFLQLKLRETYSTDKGWNPPTSAGPCFPPVSVLSSFFLSIIFSDLLFSKTHEGSAPWGPGEALTTLLCVTMDRWPFHYFGGGLRQPFFPLYLPC